ncbi:serine hydrolase [Nesterenkonia muleiensis]|uniref:serine hydrolase n=1 Tax=Nesterenkonia muleiensis TaxID=2282648 RepID=UPI000E771408|nr:serine hydrolase [Nesterenkonia muleiensis]
MHSRLPLIAGVPGRLSVAALTAALLASGCAPNFHSPEPADIEPVSAAHALPTAVQNTAESTMRDAAEVVVHRVLENHPAPEELGTAGQLEQPDADDAPDQADAGPEDHAEQRSSHQQRLEDWADSLTRAHETAQERQRREAEVEAEDRRQAEVEEDEAPRGEDEAEQQAEEQAEPDIPEDEPTQETVPPDPPAEPNNPTYTGDLDAYLADLANSHPGRISISLQEVGGQSRSGSTGGADSFVTASTYKVLVAYSIIRQVEAGSRSWDDMVLGGRDLAQCFHDMIVLSDNPCPEKLGPEIGWGTIYSDAAAMGASSTGGGEGGIRTNALDLTRFMTNLAAGTMAMSGSGHESLRSALASNIHRQGIPAGSAGQVLNKPGFISGNLHDTAIVYHPSGTYVLTILSQGSSWDSLASITRSIESALFD